VFLVGLLLTTVGLFCFAASQAKQAALMFGTVPSSSLQRANRGLAWALLLGSTLLGISTYGFGVGLVSLFAWVFTGGWVIALALSWRRRVAS